MMTAGRILHHLRQRLPDARNTIIIGGYQAPGTRGRLLQDGAKFLRMFGFEVPVSVPGVDTSILDPRSTWADKDEYDRTAAKLVDLFVANFAEFAEHVDEGVRQSGPQAAQRATAPV